ncbi:MAG: hypothetical protein Q9164_001028 [Protoblastenia rupestris]
MWLWILNPWVVILISTAHAFDVLFNNADRCAGNNVGEFVGSYKNPAGCQTSYTDNSGTHKSITAPGGNFNVIINPEGRDIDAGVAFYGLEDCQLLIGFGNVKSCLGTGYFTSFQVIDIDEADDQLTNLDPAPVQSLETNATATDVTTLLPPLSTASSTASSPTTTSTEAVKVRRTEVGLSSHPRTLSKKSGRPGRISHGDVYPSNGEMYKYHQVSANVWRGIPLSQWDNRIHKRNMEPLPSSKKERSLDTSPPSLSPLTKKAILPDKCNLVRSCMIESPSSPNFSIHSVGMELLGALEAHSKDGEDWQFLKQPFVVEIINRRGQSQGFIYAQTVYHSDVTPCSGEGTERDAVRSALTEGVDGTDISDLRVDLKIGLSGVPGATNTLFVSTRSAGNGDVRIRPICEAIQVNY